MLITLTKWKVPLATKIIHIFTTLFKKAIKMNNAKNTENRNNLPRGFAEKYQSINARIYGLRYNENDGDSVAKMARESRVEKFMRGHIEIVEKMSDIVFEIASFAKQNDLRTVLLSRVLATSFPANLQINSTASTPIDKLLDNLRNSKEILELEIKNQPTGRQAIGQVRYLLEAGTDALQSDQMPFELRSEIGKRWVLVIDELNSIFDGFDGIHTIK
jgi:hypothetical protein